MKKILKYLFAILTGFSTVNTIVAQQREVHIYDLNYNTTNDSSLARSGNIKLNVRFKVKSENEADSVFFMFGIKSSTINIKTVSGKFQSFNGKHFVEMEDGQYSIKNTEVVCRMNLTISQFKSSKFLSVFVKDKKGNISNTLQMRVN